MNFAGSGLALAIIVALWLLVFVPAWFQRSANAEAERENNRFVSRSLKQEVRANLHREKREHLVVEETRSSAPRVRVSGRAHTVAAKIFRLRAARKALVVALVAGMFAVVASVVMLSISSSYWAGVAGGFAVVIGAAWATRAVSDRLAVALEASNRMRSSAISALHYSTRGLDLEIEIEADEVNPRAWTATELPAPRSNVGQIVETSFAEVLAFEPTEKQNPVLDIDSILERRRQVG